METLVWTGELNQVTGTIHMCMAVLFYTHQHLSSASVIRMLFPVSSGDLFYSSCASICLHKSLIFPVIQFVLVNIILFLISPQFILVSDVFPTSPQFVFDFFFLFQMIPVIGEEVLFSATPLLSWWIASWRNEREECHPGG